MDDITFDLNITVAGILILVDLTIRIIALLVVPKGRRPQTGMAWLLLIFWTPILGGLIFLLLGSRHLSRRRREKQREINDYILETTDGIDKVSREHPWPPYLERIVQLNRNLGAMPLVGGNDASLYPDYDESLAAMTDEVDAGEAVRASSSSTSSPSTTRPSRCSARWRRQPVAEWSCGCCSTTSPAGDRSATRR